MLRLLWQIPLAACIVLVACAGFAVVVLIVEAMFRGIG